MAEPSNDPTSGELLERIIKLETEASTHRAQINFLEEQNVKLAALIRKHVIRLDNRILNIDDQLLDVLDKLFPGHVKIQAQILDVVKPGWRDDVERPPRHDI